MAGALVHHPLLKSWSENAGEPDDWLRFVERGWGARGAGYLSERIAQYSQIHVARACTGVSAVMLTDRAVWGEVEVHYVGPVFSMQRAYLSLFARWVDELATAGAPFCIVAEIESDLVARDMTRLLSHLVYPRAGVVTPPVVRDAASATSSLFSHVRGFDPATLTTEIVDPFPSRSRRARSSRYQLLLLPCFGAHYAPQTLREELAHGLERLKTRPLLRAGA
jgi:hypothetical protein